MSALSALLALGLAAGSQVAHAYGPPGGFGGSSSNRGGPQSTNGNATGGQTTSPTYNYMFQFPLPIPTIAQPSYTTTEGGRKINYYFTSIESFTAQIYPNLGPAHMIGYNGTAPGPMFVVERGTESVIRYVNNGEVSAAVHLHGSYTHAAWDGWAADEIPVGSYKDYYYPNTEAGRSIWYHDHAEGHTSTDAYYGQAGAYTIHDPAEDALGLPSGKHDVPLALTDKSYQSNGDLASPTGSDINFFGDVMHVNDQPWPYLAVEPRKYRFRIYDMSLSRPYDLWFEDTSGQAIPFQVIASDSGLFGAPVSSSDLTISMGERYEVVIDFAKYSGQNITLGNKMENPQVKDGGDTDKLMRFVVGKTVTDNTNNGAVPSVLNGNIPWPASRTTVDHTFNFQLGGESTWTINGVDFDDAKNRVLARPPQGTVELWELHHTGGPAVHPVHVHLVNMQILSRTGGSRGLLPYEAAGLKDVVLLLPGETVHVLAEYGPWNGVYMFHCHNLIHEDHTMLAAFNVTALSQLGYDFSETQQFADPYDPRFSAQTYNDSLASPAAVAKAVNNLAVLDAYLPVMQLMSAEAAYYSTAGYHGDAYTVAQTTTASPVSSGYGFATATHAGAATAYYTPSAYTQAGAAAASAPTAYGKAFYA